MTVCEEVRIKAASGYQSSGRVALDGKQCCRGKMEMKVKLPRGGP
jgi:hypothetical protein